MPVSKIGPVQVPVEVAAYVDKVMLVFLGLFVLWVLLKLAGFALRRAYNLTPVATGGHKDIKPDFLKVDHAAQEAMLERGKVLDQGAAPAVTLAARVTSWTMLASGLVSFVSTAFLAVGRIGELDETWRTLSAKDRFVAIVQSHPYGFAIAICMVVAALVRLVMSLRKAK
jgi:hypothetical protein